jgi:hypothetical protein
MQTNEQQLRNSVEIEVTINDHGMIQGKFTHASTGISAIQCLINCMRNVRSFGID